MLDGWPGMAGHNWGAQHAETWLWLHGIAFAGAAGAWLDLAVGRVRVAGRTTPWIANGALELDGRRHVLGGLRARGGGRRAADVGDRPGRRHARPRDRAARPDASPGPTRTRPAASTTR